MLFFKVYDKSLNGFKNIIDKLGFPTLSRELNLATEDENLDFPLYLALSGLRFHKVDEEFVNSNQNVTLVKVKPNIKVVKSNNNAEVSRKETIDIYPNIRLSNFLSGKVVFKATEDIYQNDVLRIEKGSYFINDKGKFIKVEGKPTFKAVNSLSGFYLMVGDALKIIETR